MSLDPENEADRGDGPDQHDESGEREPVGRGRRLSPDERRSQILEIAMRLFGAHGYAEVSVGDVAAEAEIARPLVHHYFGSKEDLYIEVLAKIMGRATVNLKTADDMPLEDLVPHNWDALLEFFETSQAYVRGIMMFDGPVKRTSAQLDDFVEDLIDRSIQNRFGTVEVPESVRFIMRCYSGMVLASVREWLVFDRASREQVQALLVESQWAMMRDVVPKLVGDGGEQVDPAPAGS